MPVSKPLHLPLDLLRRLEVKLAVGEPVIRQSTQSTEGVLQTGEYIYTHLHLLPWEHLPDCCHA